MLTERVCFSDGVVVSGTRPTARASALSALAARRATLLDVAARSVGRVAFADVVGTKPATPAVLEAVLRNRTGK